MMPLAERSDAAAATGAPSSSFTASSRSSSYEHSLDALRSSASEPSLEFGIKSSAAAAAPSASSKNGAATLLDNPLAQVLSIRATIAAAPTFHPGLQAFPALARPALASALPPQHGSPPPDFGALR